MKCRNSLHQPLRSDLGVLINHVGRSSVVRLRNETFTAVTHVCDFQPRTPRSRKSAQRAVVDTAVKASGGDDTSRFVCETHRAVTLFEHSHLNSSAGHVADANVDRCVH